MSAPSTKRASERAANTQVKQEDRREEREREREITLLALLQSSCIFFFFFSPKQVERESVSYKSDLEERERERGDIENRTT